MTETPSPELLADLERPREWRCFQCDEVFTTTECASEHFGEFQDCVPICKVGAERYRDLENQLAVFQSESDEASKTFYGFGAKHAHALIQEEQKGYDKGLADGRAESLQALASVTAERDRLRAVLTNLRDGYLVNHASKYVLGEVQKALSARSALNPNTREVEK